MTATLRHNADHVSEGDRVEALIKEVQVIERELSGVTVQVTTWKDGWRATIPEYSAMVPHAGTDTRVWRDVVELGTALRRLVPVASSTVDVDVAVVLDYPRGWAAEGLGGAAGSRASSAQPSVDMGTFDEVRRWYGALWRAGVTADFARPGAELSRYRAVFIPPLYLVSGVEAAHLVSYVDSGGTLLVGPYSGVVNEGDRVRLGGYPGAFHDLLGVHLFLVNHAGTPATVAAAGTDVLTGDDVSGEVTVPAGGVVVLRSSGNRRSTRWCSAWAGSGSATWSASSGSPT